MRDLLKVFLFVCYLSSPAQIAIKYVNNIQLVFIICTTLISFIVYLGMKHEEYYENKM